MPHIIFILIRIGWTVVVIVSATITMFLFAFADALHVKGNLELAFGEPGANDGHAHWKLVVGPGDLRALQVIDT